MAYTGKLRSIGVGISHQLSITYELSSSKKGERGGGAYYEIYGTHVFIFSKM